MKDFLGIMFFFVLPIVMLIGAMSLGASLGIKIGNNELDIAARRATAKAQREAVESGHAEYYLDGNHYRQFRWKDCEGCEGYVIADEQPQLEGGE